MLDDRYCAFWDVKFFQDDVFRVWLSTDFLPIWTSEAFKLLSFSLGGLHLTLPKKMLPNAPIQLWNFWQNNFFLRSSMQSIIASSFWINFCSFLSKCDVFRTYCCVSKYQILYKLSQCSFLNNFLKILYRILFCLIWCFQLLAGDIFG